MQSAKSALEPFWELTCCKRCARLWFKARFDIIMLKAAGWRRFWKLGCWKSARRCYAKYVSKSKGWKHLRTAFGCSDVEKVHGVVAPSIFQKYHIRITFGCSNAVFRGMRKGFCTFTERVGLQGFTKTHFAWQAPYKIHHRTCLEVRVLVSLRRVQHLVWPGFTFSRQTQRF